MGSGSMAAMSVFEADYKEDMSREEAMALVARSIRAGIFNDLGSGSNVDLCVITKDGTEYLRNWEKPNARTYKRTTGYNFPPGTTKLITRQVVMPSAASLPLNEVRLREGSCGGLAAHKGADLAQWHTCVRLRSC